jgi:hypothetical protein
MILKRLPIIAFFVLFSTPIFLSCASNPLIAGYIAPAPDEVLYSLSTQKPQTPVVGGIKINYSGYVNYTNADGYFSFPKHHAAHELRIIICESADYDLLKNTVSKVQVKKVQQPTIAVYKITKQQETTEQSAASESGTKQLPTDPQPGAWYFKVESLGNSLPDGLLSSHDCIIYCHPSELYLQDGAVHYAEENSNFILPLGFAYLLKTPAATSIERTDVMTLSVDSCLSTDSVENTTPETDSMGNPLPGIQRTVIATPTEAGSKESPPSPQPESPAA